VSNVLIKFCFFGMAVCLLQVYLTGNWWVLAVGVTGCYVGWLIDTAGKAADSVLQEQRRRRLVTVGNARRSA